VRCYRLHARHVRALDFEYFLLVESGDDEIPREDHAMLIAIPGPGYRNTESSKKVYLYSRPRARRDARHCAVNTRMVVWSVGWLVGGLGGAQQEAPVCGNPLLV
jgi:hypothetical protein